MNSNFTKKYIMMTMVTGVQNYLSCQKRRVIQDNKHTTEILFSEINRVDEASAVQ